jgi:hypothetical protein
MIAKLRSLETLVLTRATQRHIAENGFLHSHRRETPKSFIPLTGWDLQWRSNVFRVRYELDFISQKAAFFTVTAAKTSDLT